MGLIHLDTNYLIGAVTLASPIANNLERWLQNQEQLVVSSIVWAEFLNGPVSADQIRLVTEMIENRIIAFTHKTAVVSAGLFNFSGRKRDLRFDCMIAATVLVEGGRLATNNPRDFKNFESKGLILM